MKHLFIVFAAITVIGLSSCKNSHPTEPAANDSHLLAWYKLDQNAADSSGKAHDGTMQGGSFVPDRFGSAQSALSLNGLPPNPPFVSVLNSESMNFTAS